MQASYAKSEGSEKDKQAERGQCESEVFSLHRKDLVNYTETLLGRKLETRDIGLLPQVGGEKQARQALIEEVRLKQCSTWLEAHCEPLLHDLVQSLVHGDLPKLETRDPGSGCLVYAQSPVLLSGAILARLCFCTTLEALGPKRHNQIVREFLYQDTMAANALLDEVLKGVSNELEGELLTLVRIIATKPEAVLVGRFFARDINFPGHHPNTFLGPISLDVGGFIASRIHKYITAEQSGLEEDVRAIWDDFASSFAPVSSLPSIIASNGSRTLWLATIWTESMRFAGLCSLLAAQTTHDEGHRNTLDAIGQKLVLEPPEDTQHLEQIIAAQTKQCQVVHLFLVAKFPRLGKSKTRLARDGLGDELALKFAQACVADIVDKFGNIEVSSPWSQPVQVKPVILFSPAEDLHEYRHWVDANCPKYGPKWSFQVMSDVSQDPQLGRLGNALNGALDSAHEQGSDVAVFIGMDTPQLAQTTFIESVQRALLGECCLVPASDGGYVLLSVPTNLPMLGNAFKDVAWSTSAALCTQYCALQKAGAKVVHISPSLYEDVDDMQGLLHLIEELTQTPTAVAQLPRVTAVTMAMADIRALQKGESTSTQSEHTARLQPDPQGALYYPHAPTGESGDFGMAKKSNKRHEMWSTGTELALWRKRTGQYTHGRHKIERRARCQVCCYYCSTRNFRKGESFEHHYRLGYLVEGLKGCKLCKEREALEINVAPDSLRDLAFCDKTRFPDLPKYAQKTCWEIHHSGLEYPPLACIKRKELGKRNADAQLQSDPKRQANMHEA